MDRLERDKCPPDPFDGWRREPEDPDGPELCPLVQAAVATGSLPVLSPRIQGMWRE